MSADRGSIANHMATQEARLIMLINDEPTQNRLVSALAAREGWRVVICASGKEAPSHVMQAMGVADDETDRVVRFSSGWETTADDWQALSKSVAEVAAEFARD